MRRPQNAANAAIYSDRARRARRAVHSFKTFQSYVQNHLKSRNQRRCRRRGDLFAQSHSRRRDPCRVVDGARRGGFRRAGRRRPADRKFFHLTERQASSGGKGTALPRPRAFCMLRHTPCASDGRFFRSVSILAQIGKGAHGAVSHRLCPDRRRRCSVGLLTGAGRSHL